MNPGYVIDALRTPIGRYGGGLSSVRPDDLLAVAIKHNCIGIIQCLLRPLKM